MVSGFACGEHYRHQILQRRMRSRLVVIPPPPGGQDLRLQQGGKFFAIQMFVPQPAVERFHIRVLPRTARRDLQGAHRLGLQPCLHRLGHELRRPSSARPPRPAISTAARRSSGRSQCHRSRLRWAGWPRAAGCRSGSCPNAASCPAFAATFSPSSRQSRCTRLGFTRSPSWRIARTPCDTPPAAAAG